MESRENNKGMKEIDEDERQKNDIKIEKIEIHTGKWVRIGSNYANGRN